MAYEETDIGKLIQRDPDAAAEQLIALFERANGNGVHAALMAKVHHATLKRWVNRLDESYEIKAAIETIREKSVPAKMTESRRYKLEQEARERRRLVSLQHTYDRMNPTERDKLQARAGVGNKTWVEWRRSPAHLTTAQKKLVEDALVKVRNARRKRRRARRQAESQG